MISISFSNLPFLPPWGLELYLVHRKPKSCCVPSATISELLKTVCKPTFLYDQTMLLRMRSTVRKKKMHTSFVMLNLWRLSIQEKKASKRLWEVTATQTWHLNQECTREKVRIINGVDRAVHSLPLRREMHADSNVTACWDGFLHSIWGDW